MSRGSLDDYPLAHAARADMQRRLGLTEPAQISYRRALALTRQPAERRFLQARLRPTRRLFRYATITQNGLSPATVTRLPLRVWGQ